MSDSGVSSLLAHYQLTADVCSKQVSDVHLEEISRSCCKHWKRLPPHLDLETIVVDDIDHKQVGEDEKRRLFFFGWKERRGSGASYVCLIRALLKIGSRQDAESVCRLLQPSSGCSCEAGKASGQATAVSAAPSSQVSSRLTTEAVTVSQQGHG